MPQRPKRGKPVPPPAPSRARPQRALAGTKPHAAPKAATSASRAGTEPAPKPPRSPTEDGRRLRGARARTHLLDALLSLLEEGNYSPSVQQISDRAGVSRRLVFHHFADAETMHMAFVERQNAALRDLFVPIPDSLPLPTRLLTLVEQRARIYERIQHTRRAGQIREHSAPFIHAGLAAFRQLKRMQVEAIFAPELHSCPDSVRPEIAAALGNAASFSTWDALRYQQGLSVDAASRVMGHLLMGVLRLTPAGANLILLRGPGTRGTD